ncbi:MAG TPA: hypothetical protein VEW46_25520 [Pyrinomonadaceae bacterium]|nr:hypothetical protein [Pyrinomonadaceae bacterium]
MFHTPGRTMPNLLLCCLVAALMLTLPAVVTHGQGGVGSTRGLPDSASGIHTIQGRVLLPTGRRAEQGVLVRLSSNVAGSRSASTDADGVFVFNGLTVSQY